MYMSLSYINLLFQAMLKPHLLNSAELIVRQHWYSTIFGISAGGKSEKRPKEHRGTSASEEQHPAPAVSISETRPTWMWIGGGVMKEREKLMDLASWGRQEGVMGLDFVDEEEADG